MKRSKRSTNQKSYLSQLNSSPNIEQTQLYDKLTKVEQLIHLKLSESKKLKKNFCCEHTGAIQHSVKSFSSHQTIPEIEILKMPEDSKNYDSKINYYDKFWKLYLLNEMTKYKLYQLFNNVVRLNEKKVQIQELFAERDNLLMNSEHLGFQKMLKKKNRPRESISNDPEAKRKLCPYPQCYKEYCSIVSLNLHMKLKHNAGNKSERQYYAQQIWKSIQKSLPKPQVPIQMPPGFVEEYGMLTGRIQNTLYMRQKQVFNWVGDQVDEQNICKKLQVETERNTTKVKVEK